MYTVVVATECAPAAQAGGLGDVVFGLSREVELRGHAVEIILPKYDCMRYDHVWGLHVSFKDLWVPWYGGAVHCSVWFGYVHGRKCFFIEPHSRDSFFSRGAFYGFADEYMRFAFFSKAAMEFMLQSNKRPDVIHCHDWHTALVPVMLYEIYQYHGMHDQRVCFTVHNFRHQGIAGEDVLWATGLGRPWYYFDPYRMRDDFNVAALNLMKGALLYSNFITTVSRRHAWEVRHSDQGFGLGHSLFIHQSKFGGVLNGVDYEIWNPETDKLIPYQYGVENLQPKYGNKQALRERFWLRQGNKPIVAYVGRLDAQKGLDLIRHAIFYSLSRGAQFVLLGPGSESDVQEQFWRLKRDLNDNPDCHLEIGFSQELAHLIYAGADIVVVPSNFEPCGLTPLIAMRYGTVPAVRGIGGLLDTVSDRDYSDGPADERSGYVFYQSDPQGVESALRRAIDLWYDDPGQFRQLMINGMRRDFSWRNAATDYIRIYDHIRYK
jgi:starch synthase